MIYKVYFSFTNGEIANNDTYKHIAGNCKVMKVLTIKSVQTSFSKSS